MNAQKAVQNSPLSLNTDQIEKKYTSVKAERETLDKVFSLRYRSYIAENYIKPNDTHRFFDAYDYERNCHSYLVYYDMSLMGSMRLCLYNPTENIPVPAMEIFNKELESEIGYDDSFIELNKFVIAPEFQRRGGIVARFNMFKKIGESTLAMGAKKVIIAVRPEHVRFYKHFSFSVVSDAKPYPHLTFKTVLLVCYNLEILKRFIWGKAKRISQ